MASSPKPTTGFYLVSRLQEELDRAIARAGELAQSDRPADLAPPMDVVETEDAVVIVVEVPGLAAGDLAIEASGNRLLVRGRRKAAATGSGPVRFHCMECGRGEFQRSIELVGALDTHATHARLEHGLLRIRIPKIANRRLVTRRIEIESAGG